MGNYQKNLMNTIKNIIFDLGGVIINLDTQATFDAFKDVLGEHYEGLMLELRAKNIFDLFEMGKMSEDEFIEHFTSSGYISREQVVDCWNKMLLNIPANRIEMLKRLRADYTIYLLSNTNITHVKAFEQQLLEVYGIQNFRQELFEMGFYSFEMDARKPNADIYEKVLKEAQLDAAETLFIDDNADNIRGAAGVGIQTIHHIANTEPEPVLMAYLK